MSVSTEQVTQIKAAVAELAATAQQTQTATHMLAQQQSAGPATADLVQLQHDLRTLDARLQQLQVAQTESDDRWQAVEAAVARRDPAEGLKASMSLQVQAMLHANPLCHVLPQAALLLYHATARSCNDAETISTHQHQKLQPSCCGLDM